MSGLNRFDGYSFKVFSNSAQDSTSLVDNYVNKLFEDPDGRIYGGYARKDETMQQTSPLTGTINTSSYVGKWNVRFKNINGTLTINKLDAIIAASFTNGRDYDGFSATLSVGKMEHPVKFFADKKNPNHITIQIPGILGTPGIEGGAIRAYLLNFDKSTLAGTALYSDSQQYGFLMMRIPTTTVPVPAR